MTTFDDSMELAAGSVRGVRIWFYDMRIHALRGMFNQVWAKDVTEHIASCHIRIRSVFTRLGFETLTVKPHLTPPPKDFDLCGCGFYAYWKNEIALLHPNTVMGVIEGSGRTLIGTQGFRSQKARILGFTLLGVTRFPERIRSRVERDYGVPFYPSAEELLEAHPTNTEYYQAPARTIVPETAMHFLIGCLSQRAAVYHHGGIIARKED